MAGLLTGKTDYSGVGVYEPKTGFSENFDRQVDLVYNSGQSVSEYNALQEGYDKRIDSVKELTGVELENPYSVGNVFNLKESSEKFETEFNEATSNLDELQRERLEDRDKMWRGIRERHKRLRLGADFSSERASTMGKVGGFLGGMTGLLLDPLQIATLPFGVGSLAGKTVLQAAGRTALTEAAIGGTVEIPIQGLVQPFQKELGVEGAGFKAGAINVGAATAGAGFFGGLVGGGVRALQLKFGKSIDSMTTGELAENLRKIKNPTKEQKELAAALSKEAQAENSNPYIEKPKRVFQGDQDVTPTPKGPEEQPLEVTPEAFKELEETRKAAQVEVDEARKAVEGIGAKEAGRAQLISGETELPKVKTGQKVDGLAVRESIPNQESIAASLTDFEILPGVRKIKMSDFDNQGAPSARARELVEQISKSGEINPLIVVIDNEGPYVLEGANRFDALGMMEAESFPALIVRDLESIRQGIEPRKAIDEPLKPKAKKKEDSLLQTISKMGGINRQDAIDELGLDPGQLKGSRAFKVKGGQDLDRIGEGLVERNFLKVDEITGKYDPRDLEDLIGLELRGGKAERLDVDIPEDEIEAAFVRSFREQVDPELQAARDRLADAEDNLASIRRDLDRAKVIEHEKNIAEADKALAEGRQPNIAENRNTQNPQTVKGRTARADAEDAKVYDDPHEQSGAFDEQTRTYEESLREASENPEKLQEELPGNLEVDENGKVVARTQTFESLAEELEADEKFINDLAQCLR